MENYTIEINKKTFDIIQRIKQESGWNEIAILDFILSSKKSREIGSKKTKDIEARIKTILKKNNVQKDITNNQLTILLKNIKGNNKEKQELARKLLNI